MALWCAYVLTTPAGASSTMSATRASATAGSFSDVRERFGAPRVAHLPIGAYEPRWFMGPQHMNPDDAVQACEVAGAAEALGHHWGTFRLTNEADRGAGRGPRDGAPESRHPDGAVQGLAARRGVARLGSKAAAGSRAPYSFGWT